MVISLVCETVFCVMKNHSLGEFKVQVVAHESVGPLRQHVIIVKVAAADLWPPIISFYLSVNGVVSILAGWWCPAWISWSTNCLNCSIDKSEDNSFGPTLGQYYLDRHSISNTNILKIISLVKYCPIFY